MGVTNDATELSWLLLRQMGKTILEDGSLGRNSSATTRKLHRTTIGLVLLKTGYRNIALKGKGCKIVLLRQWTIDVARWRG
jgi:hypothetical protein